MVEQEEVAVIARTLRVQVTVCRIDSILEASGWIEVVGIWDSGDDLERIAAELEPARARRWERFGTNPPIGVFEVADELGG